MEAVQVAKQEVDGFLSKLMITVLSSFSCSLVEYLKAIKAYWKNTLYVECLVTANCITLALECLHRKPWVWFF